MRELWRQFEGRIKEQLNMMGVVVTHIPSHILQTKRKMIRLKTDCDFAAAVDGKAIFFDAKSCAGNKFYFSEHKTFEKEKKHQFDFLTTAKARGSEAGYLIWLYDKRLILWVPIDVVFSVHMRGEKGIDESTPGVKMQSDSEVIDLSRLLWKT